MGGCVRDSLLGREPNDWDVCTSALPDAVCALFDVDPGIGTRHGTVKVGEAEVTTFRRDVGYSDGRRPDAVEFVTELKTDLQRRDFTVNAMAYNNGLHDYFGGEDDLRRGIIRTVGEPDRRFKEDSLRILRAMRFAAVLGFEPERDTAAAMLRCGSRILELPVERFYAELAGLLRGRWAQKVLDRFSDILRPYIPQAVFDLKGAETLEQRLALMFGEESGARLKSLHVPVKTRKAVEKIIAEGM